MFRKKLSTKSSTGGLPSPHPDKSDLADAALWNRSGGIPVSPFDGYKKPGQITLNPQYTCTIGIDPSTLLKQRIGAGILVPKMSMSSKLLERRRSERMAIEQDVRYCALTGKDRQLSAGGRTINISSSGVMFTRRCFWAARWNLIFTGPPNWTISAT